MKQIALLLAAVGACGGSPQIPPAEPSTPPVSTAPSAGASQTPAVTPPPAAGPQPGVMAASSASPPRSATAPSPIVDAPDRSDQDRALDPGRHPLELLAFAGIKPGMHVADLQAGGGYTTEILARAVGPGGVVYSQNNKFVASRAEKPWSERLAKPALANVKRVDRELGDPLPPQAHDLDAVFLVLFYHDAVWMGADLDKMNRAIFAALKPGGEYIVVDHDPVAACGGVCRGRPLLQPSSGSGR